MPISPLNRLARGSSWAFRSDPPVCKDPVRTNLHATAVALDAARAVLILGPPGSGKSTLALRLMGFGARLVADDRVDLEVDAGALWASPPASLRGLIEARGVGILGADPLERARIVLIVDLGQQETDRLPPRREREVLGVHLPLVLSVQYGHLDVAILQWLKAERLA